MQLIGIHGKARSGKTSVATWLGKNRDAFAAAFADPIKQTIVNLFGLTWDYFHDAGLKEAPIHGIGRSPRYLAQSLGTEWGRDLVHPDIWVFAMQQYLAAGKVWGKLGQMIVIHDLRFENEAKWIREHGTVLHITRPGADGNVGIEGHASEAGIVPVAGDLLIRNDGSLEDLYGALEALFKQPPEEHDA